VGAMESVANGASFGGNLGFWVLELRLWGVKLSFWRKKWTHGGKKRQR
jgi:hypothetical protein